MKNKTYYIYAYFLNKKAIYVGHTTNVKERDWGHSHYSETRNFKIPFHRFMKESGGRKKFILRVLGKAKSEREAVKLENWMMEKHKTLHKFGGFNFCLAQIKFNKKTIHEAWKASLSKAWTDERKKKTSERMTLNNPSKRAEVRKSISETVKEKWKDPETRKAMLANNLRGTGRTMALEQRERLSNHMKKVWVNRRSLGLIGLLSKIK